MGALGVFEEPGFSERIYYAGVKRECPKCGSKNIKKFKPQPDFVGGEKILEFKCLSVSCGHVFFLYSLEKGGD